MSQSQNYVSHSTRSGLSDSDVLDIRLASRSTSVRNIARQMTLPKSTVHDIISGKTWGHVPNPVVVYRNYSVFPDGRVWSNKSNKFLTSKLNRNGTLTVEVTVNGSRKTVQVATLVARAFLGSRGSRLNYKDGDRTNVHFTNLRSR